MVGIAYANVKALPMKQKALPNPAMDTSQEDHIGQRLKLRMQETKRSESEVARHFGVQPPSVYDWIKYGRIAKKHIPGLVALFGGTLEWWLLGGDEAPKTPNPLGKTITADLVFQQLSGVLHPMGLKLDDVIQDRDATLRHLAARLAGQDEQAESASDTGSMIAQTALTGGDKRGKRRSTA